MGLFQKLIKGVGSLIPGGGIVSSILAPGKTPEEVSQGLSSLDPIAQYNRTMARPRIALGCVYTYLGLVVLSWLLNAFGQYAPLIPDTLKDFATIAVGFYMGSRGIEKVVTSIFKKKKKKKVKK